MDESMGRAKKRRQSPPRKVIVAKINLSNQNICESVSLNNTNDLKNKEVITEHECNSEENFKERKNNSMEQTDDNHLYRDGATNYESSHNEVVEDKLSIEDSYGNENHNIEIPITEETIKENCIEQENEGDSEFKDETIYCENKCKEVGEDRQGFGGYHDRESYNLVNPISEEIAKGKGIEQEYESDKEIQDETINYENRYNEVEEDNPCMRSSHDVENCNKHIPLVEDMTKEKRIEETEEKKVENVECCENHKSSQSDDNCEKNQTKVTGKEECIGQEGNKSQDKDDLANCNNSSQEAEGEKLNDRNSQNGINKNETSLKDFPSIENAAKEVEDFSGTKAIHDKVGGCSDYSTITDKIKNNKKINYSNNNRDYCQWGDLKITIYGVVNIYTNGKKSHRQVEKKEREGQKVPPIGDDSMNVDVKEPDGIIHNENDIGKEKMSEKIKKKDESPLIQPKTEGVRKQRQQVKQKQQKLQPDEVWSVDDCRILENLMVNYKANKWLELQAQFFNWTDRMISADLIAQKFHDDC